MTERTLTWTDDRLASIAAILSRNGPEWTPDRDTHGRPYLRGPQEAKVSVVLSRGRLVLSGDYGFTPDGRWWHPSGDLSFTSPTVAPSTDDLGIANAISRRLLPPYFRALAAYREQFESAVASERAIQDAVRRVTAAAGHTARRSRDTQRIAMYAANGDVSGEVWVTSGDTARFERFYCPVDVAERVVAMIAASYPPQGE